MAEESDRRQHWERVYATSATDRVGWFRPHLETSLAWIERVGLPPDAPIIDIGGGASTLVDDLIDADYRDITVLDISEAALSAVQQRLGSVSAAVTWIQSDVTEADLPAAKFRLWHDRAVFHFLLEAGDRLRYREAMLRALTADGHAIIATFSPDAPPRCSGLPVRRYSAESLSNELGPGFDLVDHAEQLHITPGGVRQPFQYCLFRRA